MMQTSNELGNNDDAMSRSDIRTCKRVSVVSRIFPNGAKLWRRGLDMMQTSNELGNNDDAISRSDIRTCKASNCIQNFPERSKTLELVEGEDKTRHRFRTDDELIDRPSGLPLDSRNLLMILGEIISKIKMVTYPSGIGADTARLTLCYRFIYWKN